MLTGRKPWTLLAVTLATFMTYLDNNVINVALPDIRSDLHLSVAQLEWVVSGYVLVFAGLLLAGGRLADVFGRRRFFLAGLAIFTLSSLAAGLAGDVTVLIAGRAVQGLGAALVTPTALAIISATFAAGRERATAVGIWAAVGALALAFGPLIGGLLTQHVSWHWIFFVNVPVGVVTAALGVWAISDSRDPEAARSVDVPGVVTSAGALFAVTYALIEGHSRGWTSGLILGTFAAAAVLAGVFVAVERRSAAPMVRLDLFSERVFGAGLVALMMWAFGLFGIYFFTSLYLQDVLGFSPTKAGAAFVPMALCMAATAVVSERVARRFGAHRSIGLAMLAMGAGIASVATLGAHASFIDLMPSFVVIGLGGGLTTSLTANVLEAMPSAEAGVASGIFNATREVAGLLGITVIGAVLASRQGTLLASGDGAVDAFLGGYRTGLVVAALLVAAGGVAAFVGLRPRGPRDESVTAQTSPTRGTGGPAALPSAA